MPAGSVDLQTHSTYSDGTCTPRELVELAAEAGLAAVALTDHDTVEGVPEFLAAGEELGVETLPAVELSVQTPYQGVDVLGYLVDHEHPALLELLEEVRGYRRARTPHMLEKLAELGVELDLEDVQAQATGEVVGRPHVARALREAGHVETLDEAFDLYIGRGAPAYVPKERASPQRAIDAVHAAGGVAVLAHPCFVHPMSLTEVVRLLVDAGLDGLEVWYSRHDADHVAYFSQIAERFDLVKTGGSDFHGENKPDLAIGVGEGGLEVPYAAVKALKERKARRAP